MQHGASTHFYVAPADHLIQLTTETTNSNPPAKGISELTISRMHTLQSCPIGDLLVMLQHLNAETTSFREPLLQVIVSPTIYHLQKDSNGKIAIDIADSPIRKEIIYSSGQQ